MLEDSLDQEEDKKQELFEKLEEEKAVVMGAGAKKVSDPEMNKDDKIGRI